jgi:hypothetical protein
MMHGSRGLATRGAPRRLTLAGAPGLGETPGYEIRRACPETRPSDLVAWEPFARA